MFPKEQTTNAVPDDVRAVIADKEVAKVLKQAWLAVVKRYSGLSGVPQMVEKPCLALAWRGLASRGCEDGFAEDRYDEVGENVSARETRRRREAAVV